MFVYGKKGSKAPYAINILTLFKLSEIFENLIAKKLTFSNKNFFIRVKFLQKNLLGFLFMDATYN
jgi:hypothetical protein